jgi:hypothetical protein
MSRMELAIRCGIVVAAVIMTWPIWATAAVQPALVVDTMESKTPWKPAENCSEVKSDGRACICMQFTKQPEVEYPGTTRDLASVDFSNHDVMTLWIKSDVPCPMLQIVLRNSKGIYSEMSVASLTGETLTPGKWYFVVWPYRANPGWVHPFTAPDRGIDWAAIGSLGFYSDTQRIPAAKFSFLISDIRVLTYSELQKNYRPTPGNSSAMSGSFTTCSASRCPR